MAGNRESLGVGQQQGSWQIAKLEHGCLEFVVWPSRESASHTGYVFSTLTSMSMHSHFTPSSMQSCKNRNIMSTVHSSTQNSADMHVEVHERWQQRAHSQPGKACCAHLAGIIAHAWHALGVRFVRHLQDQGT